MKIEEEYLVAQIRPEVRRVRRFFAWAGVVLLSLLAALAVAGIMLAHRAEPFLRARIVQALEHRFHSRVELDGFHLSLVRGIEAQGQGLRIWPPAEGEGNSVAAGGEAPLIRLDTFSFHAPLRFNPSQPLPVGVVELRGLDIRVPPRSRLPRASGVADKPTPASRLLTFGVDRVVCQDAHLVLETSKPGKLPLDFAIARFELSGADGGAIRTASAMRFVADLTNPRPEGVIHSSGSLGPWQAADPGDSPLQGQYSFDHADLATFKGIAGILSSTGNYQGTLRDLSVDGETDTPDFRLTHFGSPIPLHTHFHAKVDATNGDTWLEPVDAVLGRSHFTAKGQVVRVVEADPATGRLTGKGHDIALNVTLNAAPIDDFLRLTSRAGAPALTGALTMRTALHIPPGPASVLQRIQLKGNFNLDQVRFASATIQSKITDLSLLGEGRRKDMKAADPNATRSTMQSPFTMANGVITLPALVYTVPGATIQLAGAYGTEGGALDFSGYARLNATVSQMVGGVWGVLLKPADKLFKKNGVGTEIPIKIDGTRQEPHFGLDFHRKKEQQQQPAPAR